MNHAATLAVSEFGKMRQYPHAVLVRCSTFLRSAQIVGRISLRHGIASEHKFGGGMLVFPFLPILQTSLPMDSPCVE